MKKSTLITTIAMIVVVVVALSTATYAWFTAGASTQTTQTIETQGQTGITVLTNSKLIESAANDAATFDATTLLPNTYKVDSTAQPGLRQNLWAPRGTIGADVYFPTANTATATKASALMGFISGEQDRAGTTFTVKTTTKSMSPDLIRVTNNTDGALQHIYLNIYIAADANLNSFYAAQGVSFVLVEYNTGSAGTLKANTKYGYLPSNAEYVDVDTSESESMNDTYAISAFQQYTTNPVTSTFNHRALTDADPGTGWSDNLLSGVNAPASGITAALGDTSRAFYCISIDLGQYNQGAFKNYLMYTWLDGTYLDDSASNAGIAIVYSFAEGAVTQLGAAA